MKRTAIRRATGLLLLSTLLWTGVTSASQIDVSIYGTRSGYATQPSFASWMEGIALFEQILKTHCDITLSLKLQSPVEVTVPAGASVFAPSSFPVEDGEDRFPFSAYQGPLYHFLKKYPFLPSPRSRIVLLFVEGLSNHYANALPRVQFPPEPLRKEWEPIVHDLANFILIDTNPQERPPVSRRRTLAHELGHLFVQDNPPHQCWQTDRLESCPGENLMADVVRVNSSPGRGPRVKVESEGEPDDPLLGREVPATGTMLDRKQCEAARRTLNTWLDLVAR